MNDTKICNSINKPKYTINLSLAKILVPNVTTLLLNFPYKYSKNESDTKPACAFQFLVPVA